MARKWRWVSPVHWERTKNLSDSERKRYWIQHHMIWRRVKQRREAEKAEKIAQGRIDPLKIGRQREIKFVEAFFPRFIVAIHSSKNERDAKDKIIAGALLSLKDAGYRTPIVTKDGVPTKRSVKKAKQVLALPRIGNALMVMCEAKGLTLELMIDTLRTIIEDAPNDKKSAISAINTTLKYTVGTTTNNNNLNVNVSGDKLYDDDMWSEEPGIELDD